MSWWNVRYVELQENRAMVTPSWWSRNFTIFIWNVSYSVRPQRITNSNRTRTKLPKFRFLTLITPHCLCFLCCRSDRKTTIKIWKRRNILRIDIEMTKSQNLISSWDWLTFCLHFMKCLHLVEFQLGTCPGCPWLDKKLLFFSYFSLPFSFLFFSLLLVIQQSTESNTTAKHSAVDSISYFQLLAVKFTGERETSRIPSLSLFCAWHVFIIYLSIFIHLFNLFTKTFWGHSFLGQGLTSYCPKCHLRH